MLKICLTCFSLILGMVTTAPVWATDNASQKRRVVLQVNDNDEKVWSHALTLAENMQANSGGRDKIDIQIVAMSPGIRMVASDSRVSDRVRQVIEKGVLVRACNYTMSAIGWGPEKLATGVQPVPFGALEIVDKQMAGWAYIKP